jgi:DNA-binding MarR family transcriptional regulator
MRQLSDEPDTTEYVFRALNWAHAASEASTGGKSARMLAVELGIPRSKVDRALRRLVKQGRMVTWLVPRDKRAKRRGCHVFWRRIEEESRLDL